jgi:hypothetical protein
MLHIGCLRLPPGNEGLHLPAQVEVRPFVDRRARDGDRFRRRSPEKFCRRAVGSGARRSLQG